MSDRTITIQLSATDPIEVRAENIVKIIGFSLAGSGYSIPQIHPAEATLRVVAVLRKYEQVDAASTVPAPAPEIAP